MCVSGERILPRVLSINKHILMHMHVRAPVHALVGAVFFRVCMTIRASQRRKRTTVWVG